MDLNKGLLHFLFYCNLTKMYLQQPAGCPSQAALPRCPIVTLCTLGKLCLLALAVLMGTKTST